MRRLVIVLTLALAACKPSISLQSDEWQCTKQGIVPSDTVGPRGVLLPGKRTGCTQWTRF